VESVSGEVAAVYHRMNHPPIFYDGSFAAIETRCFYCRPSYCTQAPRCRRAVCVCARVYGGDVTVTSVLSTQRQQQQPPHHGLDTSASYDTSLPASTAAVTRM